MPSPTACCTSGSRRRRRGFSARRGGPGSGHPAPGTAAGSASTPFTRACPPGGQHGTRGRSGNSDGGAGPRALRNPLLGAAGVGSVVEDAVRAIVMSLRPVKGLPEVAVTPGADLLAGLLGVVA